MNYLGETLHELNKKESGKGEEYPLCENGHAMVFTFAFPYKEYACLPCNEAVPLFNNNLTGRRSVKYMNAKKAKWNDDLHRIAIFFAGGSCDYKKKGKPCKVCDVKDYKFKYWKKSA